MYVHWCLTLFHEAAKSLSSCGKTLNLGLQICSLKPSELGTDLSRSLCFYVRVNSQKTLTRLNSWKI